MDERWNPIDTVPRDGRHVIAYCIDLVDEYDEDDQLVAKKVPTPTTVIAYWCFGGLVQYPWNGGLPQGRRYTHWMAVPAPPTDPARLSRTGEGS